MSGKSAIDIRLCHYYLESTIRIPSKAYVRKLCNISKQVVMEKDSIQRFLGITIIVIKAYGLYHRAIFSKINSSFTTTIY